MIFEAEIQEQARNFEVTMARIDKEIGMLTTDQEYVINRLEQVKHKEIYDGLQSMITEIELVSADNKDLRDLISSFDLSLDPILRLGDPNDAIKRICKQLLIENNLLEFS